MKLERTKNAGRNVVFGIIQKIYDMLAPFVIRTVMIYVMGVQYLGLNSLFASILQVLNLAELGVGSAMVYSMYKPIAEDDDEKVCMLLNLYRKYYRIIGSVILTLGLALTPFIEKLVKADTVPDDINLCVLYIMNLLSVVITYWAFAYKNSILYACQRTDMISKVSMIVSTIRYTIQIVVICAFKDFYLYTFVIIVSNFINNILAARAVNKAYPQYKPRGKISKEENRIINNRVKDLLTAKIGGIVYDSADTIVISAFLGLGVLAIYQNYFYILTSVTGFLMVAFSSCLAGFGNNIITEAKEKSFIDAKKFTFIICWLGGFCATCLLCLYQPFMELWVGKELMLDGFAVLCFVVYFFVRIINTLLNLFKDASGMWHEDKWRPLAASLVNLTLNLILVNLIGIYGVLISTVVAILFVGIPWLLKNLFSVVFERKYLKEYVGQLAMFTLVITIVATITYFICESIKLPLIYSLILRAIICCIVPNIAYFLIYRKTIELKYVLLLVEKFTHNKIPFSKLIK